MLRVSMLSCPIICRKSGVFYMVNNQRVYCPQKYIYAVLNESNFFVIERQMWCKPNQAPESVFVIAWVGIPIEM